MTARRYGYVRGQQLLAQPEPRADARRAGARLYRHGAAEPSPTRRSRRPRSRRGRPPVERRRRAQVAAAMRIARGERGRHGRARPAEVGAARAMPYGFARAPRPASLTGEADGRLDVAMREGADPQALIEVRRFLARPFARRAGRRAGASTGSSPNAMRSDGEAAADAAGSLGLRRRSRPSRRRPADRRRSARQRPTTRRRSA